MRTLPIRSAFVLCLAAAALSAHAQISQVPLFAGALNEGFETFTTTSTFANQPNPFAIFGGAGSLASTNAAIDRTGNFSLGYKGVGQATGGDYFYGNNSATAPATITFANAVGQFGGYFNVAGGGPSNNLSFSFFDAANVQVGSTQVVAMPTTNVDAFVGFSSTVPIKSVTLSGYYFVADDLRANPVPEPATIAALGLGAVALLRRRRKA